MSEWHLRAGFPCLDNLSPSGLIDHVTASLRALDLLSQLNLRVLHFLAIVKPWIEPN